MPQHKFPWKSGDEAIKFEDIADKPATYPVAAATPTVEGGVLQHAHIPQLTAAPTEADFNNLLTALQAAGILASA